MSASVPDRVIEVVPEPVTVTPPPELACSTPPVSTDRVTVTVPPLASTSATEMPVSVFGVSSLVWYEAGAVLTGASFTGVTLKVIVLGVGSVSTPPLAVPPLSRTWKVNEASAAPLLFRAGTQVRLPILATDMTWPAVTAVPDRNSVPPLGKVVMTTAENALAGVSPGSEKPKSAALNV